MNSDGDYAYLMGSLLKQKSSVLSAPQGWISVLTKDDLVWFLFFSVSLRSHTQFILVLKFQTAFFPSYLFTCRCVSLGRSFLMSSCFKYIYCSRTTDSPQVWFLGVLVLEENIHTWSFHFSFLGLKNTLKSIQHNGFQHLFNRICCQYKMEYFEGVN